MKSILLAILLSGAAFTPDFFRGNPYSASILCDARRPDCRIMTLPNQIGIHFEYAMFRYHYKKGSFTVVCQLVNPTAIKQSINRDEFSVRSTKGVTYVPEPFHIIDNSKKGPFYKVLKYPSVFPLDSGQKMYYSFSYSSTATYSYKAFKDLFKSDTICFLHTRGDVTDTLLRVVADDERLNK